MTPLQCSWSSPIDFDGLDAADKRRIQQIGIDKWIAEKKKSMNLKSKFKTGEKKVTDTAVKQAEVAKEAVIKQEVDKVIKEVTAKPPKEGSKGKMLAEKFLEIARANNGIVTYEQASAITKYKEDLPYNARLQGHEVQTDRTNKCYKLVKEKE